MQRAPVMKGSVENFVRREAARKIALVEVLVEMTEFASVKKVTQVDSASERLVQIIVMAVGTASLVHASAELVGRALAVRQGVAPTTAVAWVSVKQVCVHALMDTLEQTALLNHAQDGLVGSNVPDTVYAETPSARAREGMKIPLTR